MNIRRIPGLGLLLDPTAAEYDTKRLSDAARLSESHRQSAQEAADAACSWHAQEMHHKRLAEMYAARLEEDVVP